MSLNKPRYSTLKVIPREIFVLQKKQIIDGNSHCRLYRMFPYVKKSPYECVEGRAFCENGRKKKSVVALECLQMSVNKNSF